MPRVFLVPTERLGLRARQVRRATSAPWVPLVPRAQLDLPVRQAPRGNRGLKALKAREARSGLLVRLARPVQRAPKDKPVRPDQRVLPDQRAPPAYKGHPAQPGRRERQAL